MPVIKKGKKGRALVCDACGKESRTVKPNCPAAPELDACEQLHDQEGWSFDIGFFSMLTGHTVYCPECISKSRGQHEER